MRRYTMFSSCARRPLALFMTAVLAVSSMPMLPFAEAVAIAEEQDAKPAAAVNNASVNVDWNFSDAASITFDTHPQADGSLKISADRIRELVGNTDEVKKALTYNGTGTVPDAGASSSGPASSSSAQGGYGTAATASAATTGAAGRAQDQSAVTSAVDAKLALMLRLLRGEQVQDSELTDSGDKDLRTQLKLDASKELVKDSLKLEKDDKGVFEVTGKVAGVDAELTSPNQAIKVTKNDDGGFTVSAGSDVKDVKLALKVKGVSYKYQFSYSYQLQEKASTPSTRWPWATAPSADAATTGAPTDAAATDAATLGAATDAATTAAIAVAPTTEKSTYPKQKDEAKKQHYQEAKDKLGSASGQDALVTLTSGAVSAVDYWADLSIPTTATIDGPLTYGDDGKDYEVAVLDRAGLKGTVTTDSPDNYTVGDSVSESAGDNGASVYKVNVKPGRHTKDGDRHTLTITWQYPNGDQVGGSAGTTTVSLPDVERKKIDLSTLQLTDLPYKMPADQASAIRDRLNSFINERATAAGSSLESFYGSVDFMDDDAKEQYLAGVTTGVDIVKNDLLTYTEHDPNADADFEVVGKPGAITVKAADSRDWKDDPEAGQLYIMGNGLAGTGSGEVKVTADNRDSLWLNGTREPELKFDGSGVIAKAADNAAGTIQLDEGTFDGAGRSLAPSHSAAGAQSQDSKIFIKGDDGVIRTVTGVRFMYDSVMPTLKTLSVDGKNDKKYGTNLGAEGFDVTFVPSDVNSGVYDDSVSAEYSGRSLSRGQMNPTPLGDSLTLYGFNIGGDQKFDADSIKVRVTDNAGNQKDFNKGDSNIPADVLTLVSMATRPTLTKSWSNNTVYNGRYYNANRTLTLTVSFKYFADVQQYASTLKSSTVATIMRDGQVYKTVDVTDDGWTNVGGDNWSITVTLSEDGDYELRDVHFYDLIDREVTLDGDSFVIDKTAPAMQVAFDNNDVRNGKYYKAARTATISVTEKNFSPDMVRIFTTANSGNGTDVGQTIISGWTTNGDFHTARVTFPGQGIYTLSISGQDLATNRMTPYASPEFVVDTIKPQLKIDGVENRQAYSGDVAPSATVHDTNLAEESTIQVTKVSYPMDADDENPYTTEPSRSQTDMSVAYANPSATKGHDGVYTLTVQAVDLAGNVESQAVSWSINRFGSTYVLSDDTNKMVDEYLQPDAVSDVMVTEINPSGLDETQTAVELTRDTENVTLNKDENYTASVDSSSGWYEYTYQVKSDNFNKQDGTYRLLFHSKDVAGNSSENTGMGRGVDGESTAEVTFAVDGTKPLASFVDLSSGGRYAEATHKALVNFEDNIKLDHAVIKVNGTTYAELNANQLVASGTHEIDLNDSATPQEVSVVVYDAAGNASDEIKATNVLVTTDPLTLWLTNTQLFMASLIALAAAIGGGVLLVARRTARRGSDTDK